MGLTDRDLIYGKYNLSTMMIVDTISPTTGQNMRPSYDPFGNVFNVELDTKEITVTGRIIRRGGRQAVHNAARELFVCLYSTERKPLYHRDDPDRYEMAILTGRPMLTYDGRQGFVRLTFNCEAASYGNRFYKEFLKTSHGYGGVVSPSGTWKTYPLFEILNVSRGDTLNLEIHRSGRRQHVLNIKNMSPTYRLYIDTKKAKLYTVSGDTVTGEKRFDSSWPILIPRIDNEIRCSHPGSVRFDERWL